MRAVVTRALIVGLALGQTVCAEAPERRFSLRPAYWTDTDLQPLPGKPAYYDSSLLWDGMDNVAFRPLSDALRLQRSGEAVNVNSLDEVPDSAWFTNRVGVRAMGADELIRGGCLPDQFLDAAAAPDGSWVIDQGKIGGETPGFRVVVPGKGKYLFKGSPSGNPELQIAAATIGLAVYHAAGFFTPCEQAVRFRPALLALKPGLRYKLTFEDEKALDQAGLNQILAVCAMGDGTVRMTASAWIAGNIIGSFRYEGIREDDPNDVVPHQDRRELRASRLLAAWLNRFDTREGNTLDTWIADGPDGAPGARGYVKHYQIDTSEAFSSEARGGEEMARRMGKAYFVDWGDLLGDFVTLGARVRPWDGVWPPPLDANFRYYDVEHFVPEDWKNQYPNAAYSRMTERDAAWMARIMSRFTPQMVRALAATAQFRSPQDGPYLARVLEGRLQKILERYLLRLSPLADLRVEGPRGDQLCAVDLAERRGLRAPDRFQYDARGAGGVPLAVSRRAGGGICVTLAHVAPDGGPPDDAPARYVRVVITDGVAQNPLAAYLYDLGPSRGFVLAGIERQPM